MRTSRGDFLREVFLFFLCINGQPADSGGWIGWLSVEGVDPSGLDWLPLKGEMGATYDTVNFSVDDMSVAGRDVASNGLGRMRYPDGERPLYT